MLIIKVAEKQLHATLGTERINRSHFSNNFS